MATREQFKTHFKTVSRVSGLLILLLLLASCGRAYTVTSSDAMPIEDATTTGMLQYLENLDEGPVYTYSLDVPEEWVGSFVIRNEGNKLAFDFMADDESLPAPVFSIMALSRNQFWDQVGGYPGQYGDIVFTGDTYFVYQLPVDAYYSGLPEEVYATLAEQVPSVVSTFQVDAAP